MLLGGDTIEHYRRAVEQGAERVASRLAAVDGPFTGVESEQLESAIAGIDLDAPLLDAGAALDEIERIYLRDAVYFHHPRYLAHLNCPVAIPALLAETILALRILGAEGVGELFDRVNRLQLRDSRQMVDLQDPAGSLQLVGTLDNPLAMRLRA